MAKKIKSIKVLHFDESTEKGERIQQASVLIEIEGERPKLIQGTQVLKGDINGKHTISYTIFDGEKTKRAIYSIELLEKGKEKTKIHVIGDNICLQPNELGLIDKELYIPNESLNPNYDSSSIQCFVCKEIVGEICSLLADGIPSDDICADTCADCAVFIETLIGVIVCVAICATLCELAFDEVEHYGCKIGADFICKEIKYC